MFVDERATLRGFASKAARTAGTPEATDLSTGSPIFYRFEVTPEPARSEPVEEQAIPADDPQAVEAAIDEAAADALADGMGAVDGPGLEGAPEPIGEQAEAQAAAAEAAAIGGSPGREYAGSETDERHGDCADRDAVTELEIVARRVEIMFFRDPPQTRSDKDGKHDRSQACRPDPPPCG